MLCLSTDKCLVKAGVRTYSDNFNSFQLGNATVYGKIIISIIKEKYTNFILYSDLVLLKYSLLTLDKIIDLEPYRRTI